MRINRYVNCNTETQVISTTELKDTEIEKMLDDLKSTSCQLLERWHKQASRFNGGPGKKTV